MVSWNDAGLDITALVGISGGLPPISATTEQTATAHWDVFLT
jgi:hypothetical protein